jgi:hypothetical protein
MRISKTPLLYGSLQLDDAVFLEQAGLPVVGCSHDGSTQDERSDQRD